MVSTAITIPEQQLAEYCEQNHITKLALFGSVLREDFGPESDVDVIVEFHPDHIPGWAIIDVQDQLARLLRRKVDLLTFAGISKYHRKRILDEAKTIYDRA